MDEYVAFKKNGEHTFKKKIIMLKRQYLMHV